MDGTSTIEHVVVVRRTTEDVPFTEGRDRWYTPWGGPPDTRSMTSADGKVYANVHVGGVVRSADAGRTWQPTALDIDADVSPAYDPGNITTTFSTLVRNTGNAGVFQHVRITLPAGYTTISVPSPWPCQSSDTVAAISATAGSVRSWT